MSSKTEEKQLFVVRPMRVEDIDKCLLIWSRVELTESHQTVRSCLGVDPEGFYVAELVKSGEVVGMCAANMTDHETAFVGFYGVDPEYQGLGIGRELWSKCMHRLSPSINVGLYGVPSMTEKYKKSGFKIMDSIRMVIYETFPEEEPATNFLKSADELFQAGSNYETCHLELINGSKSKQIMRKLIEYDENVHKHSREELLEKYLFHDDSPLTFVIVEDSSKLMKTSSSESQSRHPISYNSCERKSSCARPPNEEAIIEDEDLTTSTESSFSNSNYDGDKCAQKTNLPSNMSLINCQGAGDNDLRILGYGCIRKDNNLGGMIGPIYADSGDLCEVLLRTLMEEFKLDRGRIYSVMGLDSNREGLDMLERVGFKEIDQCTRMFTKSIPEVNFSKVFYVHSPNFTIV